MQTDLLGNIRYRVNLHMHTTLSDGTKTPIEAMQVYRSKGYDALAITDHYFFTAGDEHEDFTRLSGAEYNTEGLDCAVGVWHIVGIGMTQQPRVTRDMCAQQIIDAIHASNGFVILAHPAWSLDPPEKIASLCGIDAIEIYNTVSGVHHSRRADSSNIIDMLACKGIFYPLLASDDTHYYDGTDDCVSYIMVAAEDNTREALLRAIRKGRFYATQGPEVHLLGEGNRFTVKCSPVREIIFHSNLAWTPRVFEGDALTEAIYEAREGETYLRAEVVDESGLHAWTNILPIS